MGVSCAYGEQQKTHQQYFLLEGSVKRHRVNRCLWLLQAFAKVFSRTVWDWICSEALARSSLCQSAPVLALLVLHPWPGGAKSCLTGGTRSYSFCLSAVPIHFCLTDDAVVCAYDTARVKLWFNHGRCFPMPGNGKAGAGQTPGLYQCFLIEASFGSHTKFWILLGDRTQSKLVLLLSWPCQTA